jgi:hypothetical protein
VIGCTHKEARILKKREKPDIRFPLRLSSTGNIDEEVKWHSTRESQQIGHKWILNLKHVIF